MKKIILLPVMLLCIATAVSAKNTKDDNSKAKIATKSNDNGLVHIGRNMNVIKQVVISKGELIEHFYSSDGEYLATSKNFAFDKLPKNAIKTITTSYTFPEYKLVDCIKIINADGTICYYLGMDNNGIRIILEVTADGEVGLF